MQRRELLATKQDTRVYLRRCVAFSLLPPSAFQSRLNKHLFASWAAATAGVRTITSPMFSCFSHGQTRVHHCAVVLHKLPSGQKVQLKYGTDTDSAVHRQTANPHANSVSGDSSEIPSLSSLSYRVSRPRHSPACLPVCPLPPASEAARSRAVVGSADQLER